VSNYVFKKLQMQDLDWWNDRTEFLAMCSEIFTVKLTVRTLPAAEKFSERQTLIVARNSVRNLCD